MINFFRLLYFLGLFSNNFSFRILHDHGFTDEEKVSKKCIVYNNVIESMVTILEGMKMLQIKFEDPLREVTKSPAKNNHINQNNF